MCAQDRADLRHFRWPRGIMPPFRQPWDRLTGGIRFGAGIKPPKRSGEWDANSRPLILEIA